MTSAERKIKDWLTKIDTGQLRDWPGLDHEWNMSALEVYFSSNQAAQMYELHGTEYSCRFIDLPLQQRQLQCFFSETGELKLMRLEDAVFKDKLPVVFGPLAKPDYDTQLMGNDKYAPARQLVFADKGLSIYLIGDWADATSWATAVAFYRPMPTTQYLEQLGGTEQMIYRDFEND